MHKMTGKLALNKLLGMTILAVTFSVAWLALDIQSFMGSSLALPDTQLETSSLASPSVNQFRVDEGRWRFTIKPGASLTAVAYALQRQQVLEHPRYLLWAARWQGKADQIQAGEYGFGPGATVKQLLDKITRGDVIQYPLTIIEGWNIHQLMAYMAGLEDLEQTLLGMDPATIMARLEKPDEHPEGRFFPDTYYYTRGMTDVQILRRAYQAMERFLGQAWQERASGLPYKSAYEALTMASIIEKETGLASERGEIAGVFVRRLQKRMRLQTDPTVIYGIGKHFDGNLRRRDLKADTPYNTYRRHGLPPSPIAMPGADSIIAALHPVEGHALYFVARGDGSHYFSATNAEHNRAVRKYQLKRH